MIHVALDPVRNASPEALQGFLEECRARSRRAGHAHLVSITLPVEDLDPLAVLESIYEPAELHVYAERSAHGWAVAGAEAIVVGESRGAGRFADAREFVERWLERTLVVGDLSLPFAGPHFFASFGFFDEAAPQAPFPAARVFVPRWQVARSPGGSVAVANLLVEETSDLEALAGRVWRAHQKFRTFDYGVSGRAPEKAETVRLRQRRELGPQGAFATAVARALAEISDGRFQKIVLARALALEAEGAFSPLRVLNELRQRFPDCYAWSVGNGLGASFIGASPERLLRGLGDELRTEALAGTAPRGRSASEDAVLGKSLLSSEKDLREHRLVLDSIARRFAKVGLKAEFAEKPRLLSLSNVQHLHTPVTARRPANVSLLDVLAELHPTPAVGGTPRQAACARIREWEGFDRGLYAGAHGWIDTRGGGEFFVGIRSCLIEGERAIAYAGAGIVEGSMPEREQAETELKFRALLDALLA